MVYIFLYGEIKKIIFVVNMFCEKKFILYLLLLIMFLCEFDMDKYL